MSSPERNQSKHTAGAFDIRNIIGALLGIYGVVLILASFLLDPGVNPETQEVKMSSDNLWVGIALFIAAVVFLGWAKLRPVVVDEK